MSAPRLEWRWRPRPEPPEPRVALAWNAASRRLLQRLRQQAPEVQARLAVTATPDLLVVSGAADDLPWIEDIHYAAPCAAAAGLWLPTLQEPDVPVDLLARALQARHRRIPLLLWPQPQALIPMDRQHPASAAQLDLIERRWSGAAP